MSWGIAVAGAVVGFVIGLTGMGGGALLTPILVILFGVDPLRAISSDVVASFVLKPIGGGIHARVGTVNWTLVRWLSLGSVPGAFAGAYLISRIAGAGTSATVRTILGYVLIVAASGIVANLAARRRYSHENNGPSKIRPIPTLLVGTVGGLVVGMTSVGSGSLMIVALMLLYPALQAREIVGTDLVQAIPLVGSAALGHLIFGDFQLGLSATILLGAIPGVYFGARISARGSDGLIRPILVAVLMLSGLKLVGLPDEILITVAAISLVTVLATAIRTRSR